MNGYVTYNALAWIIVGLFVGDVLAHIGKDVVKLFWDRRKARTQTH